MARLVVFTGDLGYTVRAGIVAIDRALPGSSWLVIVQNSSTSIRRRVRSQWRHLKRNGVRWIPEIGREVMRRARGASPGRVPERAPGGDASLDAIVAAGRLRRLDVQDLHDRRTLDTVREFAPDVGLSLAAPILKPALFELPRLGTLNLHKGRVPDYRGMPPAFWEIVNDEREVGCTVHRVAAGLDTGDVVAQSSVRRERYSTVRGMQLALDREGILLMRDAVVGVLQGTLTPQPQPPGGRTWRKPTLRDVALLEQRLAKDAPSTGGGLRAATKDVALGGLIGWSAVTRRLRAPRVNVLLYHRVSDDARDNLTVGVAQFDRQMALLREHCDVLSIEEVAAMREVPRGRRPLVCVTFDDGYLDNYEHAAPILKRHRIPAAFFVATGIVGSARPFPHDVRRGNEALPVMTWEQLREMARDGFTIGSHSVSHIDCAREPEDVVVRELAQSRDDLRREVDVHEPMFAYPYGGKDNMTPERLERVKQAGYTACLSAYGGTNEGSVDRYDIRRGGIHWGFSDRAFVARCVGALR